MEEHGIYTRVEELFNVQHSLYPAPLEEGTYILRLDFRGWYKKRGPALVCYFTNVRHFTGMRLFAWKRMDGTERYCPKKSDVDFRKVKEGTFWKCIIEKTRSGKLKWSYAYELDVHSPEFDRFEGI